MWIAAAVLLVVVMVSLSYPGLRNEPYDWHARLVSALKFCEYATLAPAVPLLLRGREGVRLVLRAVVCGASSRPPSDCSSTPVSSTRCSVADRRSASRRCSATTISRPCRAGPSHSASSPSYWTGKTSFGRRWLAPALAAGGLGVVISGAMTGVIGMWLALAVLAAAAQRHGRLVRRAATIATAVAILVTLGTAGIRGTALRDFAAFLGLHRNVTPGAVESYAQRTVLGYIGLKIFLTEPVTGVGYQGSSDAWAYRPQLAAAHDRFPGQPDDAFPSPKHPWGVQNLYIQTLADLGVIGAAALAGLFAAALAVGLRGGPAATLPLAGVAWLLVAAGVWIGIGIVPGIPLAALTWIALGLVSVRG